MTGGADNYTNFEADDDGNVTNGTKTSAGYVRFDDDGNVAFSNYWEAQEFYGAIKNYLESLVQSLQRY